MTTRTPALPTRHRGTVVALALFATASAALAMTPPLVAGALRFPEARTPVWLACALTATLLVVLARRLRPPRAIVLGLGWLLMVLATVQAFVVVDLLALIAMFAAAPILASLAGQLTGRSRKALVVVHVIAAACWTGVALMMSAVGISALTSDDITYVAVAYQVMEIFDVNLLAWLNFAATLSGVAVGMCTQWGVVRYWWVATKLAISLVILFSAFTWIHRPLEAAAAEAKHLAAAGGSPADLSTSPVLIAAGFGFAFSQLLIAMLLSLYKPGGRTPLGRRAIERTRRARAAEEAGAADEAAEIEVVAETADVADGVRELTLRPVDGTELPAWEPGAHVDLVLPSGLVRQYSLCGDPADRSSYRVAVLREEAGRGASAEIHRLEAPARIGVRGPRNHFPIVAAPQHLFIAGGIGIAPFVPMVRALAAREEDWRLVYRGASLASMAYARELAADFPGQVVLSPADASPRPDLGALVAGTAPGAAVYCCGPDSLIDATEKAVAEAPGRTFRIERFTATDRSDLVSRPFEVELVRTGQVVEVAEDQTMLAAIQEVEPALDMSCQDGVCGSCVLKVLDGTPEHRDDVLQPGERGRTDVIYPCVSRAVGDRLVVDL